MGNREDFIKSRFWFAKVRDGLNAEAPSMARISRWEEWGQGQ
jgi:hypothetical protein